MKKIIIKNLTLFTVILLLTVCIPYFYISFYAHPVGDDFTYTVKGKDNDLLEQSMDEYFNWNGRYSSNIFVLINPLVFNAFFAYSLVPVLIMLFTYVCLYLFIYTLTDNIFTKTYTGILSLCLFLCFLHQMPVLAEGIYWYTGTVTYQLGSCIALLYLTALLLYSQSKFVLRNRFIHLSLLTFLLIFAIGFNEVIMIILCTFSIILSGIVYKNHFKVKNIVLYLTAISVLFAMVVYFAPGNKVRESFFSGTHDFTHSLLFSLAQSIRFFLEWTTSLPLLLLSVLYYFFNRKLSNKISIFTQSFCLHPYISLFLLFFVIFISVFPAYWATGILGQHRTLNVAYFIFVILWFINLTVWFNFYKTHLKFRRIKKKIYISLFIVIWVSLLFTKNSYHVTTDIFYGKIHQYDKQMNERYTVLSRQSDTIYLQPLMDPPKSLFVLDITDNPQHWINEGYSLYFCNGKSKILKNKY